MNDWVSACVMMPEGFEEGVGVTFMYGEVHVNDTLQVNVIIIIIAGSGFKVRLDKRDWILIPSSLNLIPLIKTQTWKCMLGYLEYHKEPEKICHGWISCAPKQNR